MNPLQITQYFVFYANYGGYPETIQLMTAEKYKVFASGQPIDDRIHCCTIHLDSTKEHDPIVDIAAITHDQHLHQSQVQAIGQRVVNWLFENGYMPEQPS